MPSCCGQSAGVFLHRLGARKCGRGGLPARRQLLRAWAFKVSANQGAASLKFHHPSRELPQVESDLLGVEPRCKVIARRRSEDGRAG